MSAKYPRAPFCLLAAGACCAAVAGACSSSSNPGFMMGDDGGGTASSSSSSGSSSSGSGSGSSSGTGSSSSGTGSGVGSSSSGAGSSSSGVSSSSGAGSSGAGSSGAGSSSSSSSSGASSSSSSSGGSACAATVAAGAISLQQGGYAAVPPSTIGTGGYTFAFADGLPMGSTSCISTTAFCGMGTIGAANPPAYTIYGGGIGVNLNQLMATGAAMPPINAYVATGAGVNYALSVVPPAGTRLIIDNSPAYPTVADYCAPITLQTATIPWATFNTKCWDGTGTALAAAPAMAHHIQVEVTSGTTAGAFNFCVTSLKFM